MPEWRDDRSRMNREIHVRLREGLRVKFPWATRPGTLTGHVVQLLRELNDRAVRAAEHRVDDVTRTADEQKAQAERELADAAQTVDDLEQKLEAVAADLRKTQELLDNSREREQANLVELAQVRERLAATEERLKESEKK